MSVPSHHRVKRRKNERHRHHGESHHQPAASGNVREPAAERLGEQHDEQHERVDEQELVGADIAGLLGQRLAALDGECERQVIRRVRHGDDAEGLENGQGVRDERRPQRRPRLHGLQTFFGFLDAAAQQVADQHEHDAADERDAPSIGIDLIGRHRVVDEVGRSGSQDETQRRARGGRAADKTAQQRRCGLGRVHHRSGELTAERDALEHAHQHQQDRRQNADLFVRRQEPEHQRRAAHQRDRQREQRLSPDAVAHAAEHDAADRPREEAERERRVREKGLDGRIRFREELVADVAGKVAVDGEVEPLEHVADEAGKRGAQRGLFGA